MYISNIDERNFLNVKFYNLVDGEEKFNNYYLIFEYGIKGKKATLIFPSESFLDDAIAKGQLSGEAAGEDYFIKSDSEEIREGISSNNPKYD